MASLGERSLPVACFSQKGLSAPEKGRGWRSGMPTWAKGKRRRQRVTTGRKAARLCRPYARGHSPQRAAAPARSTAPVAPDAGRDAVLPGQLREITKGHSRQRLQRPQERRNRQGRNRQPHAQRPQQAERPRRCRAQHVEIACTTAEAGHPRQVEESEDQGETEPAASVKASAAHTRRRPRSGPVQGRQEAQSHRPVFQQEGPAAPRPEQIQRQKSEIKRRLRPEEASGLYAPRQIPSPLPYEKHYTTAGRA